LLIIWIATLFYKHTSVDLHCTCILVMYGCPCKAKGSEWVVSLVGQTTPSTAALDAGDAIHPALRREWSDPYGTHM
jgi:hypothetical protein